MTEPLRPTTAAVLAAITAFWSEHGYSPSMRDLLGRRGLASTSSVANHLVKLRDAGYITFDPRISRTIVLRRKP